MNEAKQVKHIIYIKDREMFYDPQSPRGGLIKYETALKRLQSYDAKFEDRTLAAQELADAVACGINYGDLIASKKTSKELNYGEIWEALRQHIPIVFQISKKGQALAYIVSDNKEVVKIEYQTEENLKNALMEKSREHIIASIRDFYNTSELLEGHRGKLHFGPFLMTMLKNWLLFDERHIMHEDPAHLSWDPDEYAFKKMDSRQLVPGNTPTWDEFLTRLDYPEVFMAWVWSIFEPTNNIRQVLWLRGAGADGKSSVQKAIESVIGRDYCYSMKEGDEKQQWFQSNVYGKVLVNYADCRTPYLIQNSAIKQLTGGDTTSIEGKGENSFTAKIYAKVLVTSNILPKISPELRSHTSRIIKLEVAQQDEARKDAAFEHRLQAEIYPFLAKCREHFANLVSKGNDKLILPEELWERIITECASESHMHLMDFIEQHIEFGDGLHCKTSDLNKTLREFLILEKQLQTPMVRHYEEEFKQKMDTEGCAQRRIELDGKLTTVYTGFKLKEGK